MSTKHEMGVETMYVREYFMFVFYACLPTSLVLAGPTLCKKDELQYLKASRRHRLQIQDTRTYASNFGKVLHLQRSVAKHFPQGE